MTGTEKLLAKARQAHQDALLAAHTIFAAFAGHEAKYTSVTAGELDSAAARLEKAALGLREALAIHRDRRSDDPAVGA